MDVGVYSLNACRYLTGEEPNSMKAVSSVIDHGGRFQEVEENLAWRMTFASGIVASCNTTYGADMPGFYRVHATRLSLCARPTIWRSASCITNGRKQRVRKGCGDRH
jgi:predicted dehydrogenase